MNKKKTAWRVAFLGVTVAAVVMELVAAWDRSANTEPWTHLIGQYVPGPLTLVVIVLGARWLWDHFVHEYKRRGKAVTGAEKLKADGRNRAIRTLVQGIVAAALSAGLGAGVSALSEAVSTGQFVADPGAALAMGLAGAVTAALTAGLSYLHRTVLDPSAVPSALPPGE